MSRSKRRQGRDRIETRSDDGVHLRRSEVGKVDAPLFEPVFVRLANGSVEVLEQCTLQAGDQKHVRGGIVEIRGHTSEAKERVLVVSRALQRLDLIEEKNELACDAGRLLDIARGNPSRFLALDGPPTVLVDLAGIASEGEA